MPDEPTLQRERLAELVDLAQTFRGWNRKQLAEALGRDASNLVPTSGVPKLDVVVQLAQVLEWPAEEVIAILRGQSTDRPRRGQAESDDPDDDEDDHPGDFETLNANAGNAHREGRYADVIAIARRAIRVAATPSERMHAFNREAGGWDGLGRYDRAREVLHRALLVDGRSHNVELLIRSNLANAHYSLWQLFEARGVASDLISWFEDNPPRDIGERIAYATSQYARGHCMRRLLETNSQHQQEIARLAKRDLTTASALYMDLADDFGFESYAAIADTCRGGILEAEVTSGERPLDDALAEFTGGLDALVDPTTVVGDRLEQHGWWCIFACNLALRHLGDTHERQSTLAVFSNKADEIAEKLGNWSMRERLVMLDFVRRQQVGDWTTAEGLTLDHDDVRLITGTMGRFPSFKPTGWRILRSARLVSDPIRTAPRGRSR